MADKTQEDKKNYEYAKEVMLRASDIKNTKKQIE